MKHAISGHVLLACGVRADRLVSLVLLLRHRGRLTAPVLAQELGVSRRTVLRDIEALSTAGVPVYAERGRHGGFALLPGFRAELTGLSHDEAVALLAAGSGRGEDRFGLGPALSSALRKVLDALPEAQRSTSSTAAGRILVDPRSDLLARRLPADDVPADAMDHVRRAVLAGRRLRIHYAAPDRPAAWRTVDPLGLVTVRDRGYLLATVDGADRTYRLSRVLAAEELPDPARRPDQIDLHELWRQRSASFRTAGDLVAVRLRIDPRRRDEVADTALAVHSEATEDDGRLCLEVSFQDARHALWAVWQLGVDAEALSPDWLRHSLHERAAELARRYEPR